MDKKVLFLLLNKLNDLGGDTYSKEEIDDMISQLRTFEMEVVLTLPTEDIKTNCIYFVPRGALGQDTYYEYVYVNNKWEFVGSTEVDLTNYWTIDETKQYIDDNKYVLPPATEEELGGIKLGSGDGAVTLDENGNIVISTTSDEEIESLFD